MPNEDRISELYRGEIWTQKRQEEARQRIHWMCSRADGTVLDLGCSQGIASIIVGREGLTAHGVDHELSRLVHARADLDREDPWVRKRVRFLAAEGRDLPFPDETFDTVLLGEVLEHLVLPDLLLAEVYRVLSPGGRLVVTTPAGYQPYHDHKATFYPASLARLLAGSLRVESLELTERYLLATARRPRDGEEPGGAEAVILEAQVELENRMERLEVELRRTIERTRGQLAESRARMEAAQSRIDALAAAVESERAALEEERSGRERVEASLRDERARRELAEKSLRQRLEKTRWWLEVERSRRSRRLGQELADAWPHPLRLLRLPFRFAKVLATRVPAPPEPGDGPASEHSGGADDAG